MATILLIDDHIELLDIIEDIFIREGFEVVKASSAGEAIRAALDHLPDVILCDLWLPDYSGRDVRGALAQCVETARIPFGLMTVNALMVPSRGSDTSRASAARRSLS